MSLQQDLYEQLKLRIFVEVGPHDQTPEKQISTRHDAKTYDKAYEKVRKALQEYFGEAVLISKEESGRLGAFETVLVYNGKIKVVHSKIKTRRFPSPAGLVNRFQVLLGEEIRTSEPEKWGVEKKQYKTEDIPGLRYTWVGRDYMQPAIPKFKSIQEGEDAQHHTDLPGEKQCRKNQQRIRSRGVIEAARADKAFNEPWTAEAEANCIQLVIVPFSAYNGEVLNLHLTQNSKHGVEGVSVTNTRNCRTICCSVISLYGTWDFPVHAVQTSIPYFSTIAVSLQDAMGFTWRQVRPTPDVTVHVDSHGPILLPVFFARVQPVKLQLRNALGYSVPSLAATISCATKLKHHIEYTDDDPLVTDKRGSAKLDCIAGSQLTIALHGTRGYHDFESCFCVPLNDRWTDPRSPYSPALSIIPSSRTLDTSQTGAARVPGLEMVNQWMSNEGEGVGLDHESELLREKLQKQEEESQREAEETAREFVAGEEVQTTYPVHIEREVFPISNVHDKNAPSVMIGFTITGLHPRYRWCSVFCPSLESGLPLTRHPVVDGAPSLVRVRLKCHTRPEDAAHHNMVVRTLVGNVQSIQGNFLFSLADQALVQWSQVEVIPPATVPATKYIRTRRMQQWLPARLVSRTITGEFDCELDGQVSDTSATGGSGSRTVLRVPRACIRPAPVMSLDRLWHKLQLSLSRSGAFAFPKGCGKLTVESVDGTPFEKSLFFQYGESVDTGSEQVRQSTLGFVTKGRLTAHNAHRQCLELGTDCLLREVACDEPLVYAKTSNTFHSVQQMQRGVLGEMASSASVVDVKAAPLAGGLIIPCFGHNLDGTNGNLAVYIFLEEGACFRVGGGTFTSTASLDPEEHAEELDQELNEASIALGKGSDRQFDITRFVRSRLARILSNETGWLSSVNLESVSVTVMQYGMWHDVCKFPLAMVRASEASPARVLGADCWGCLPAPSGYSRLYLPVGANVDCSVSQPGPVGKRLTEEEKESMELHGEMSVEVEPHFGCELRLVDEHLRDALGLLNRNYDEEQIFHVAATQLQNSWKHQKTARAHKETVQKRQSLKRAHPQGVAPQVVPHSDSKSIPEKTSTINKSRQHSPVSASTRMISRAGSFLSFPKGEINSFETQDEVALSNLPQGELGSSETQDNTTGKGVTAQLSVQSDAYDDEEEFTDDFEYSHETSQQADEFGSPSGNSGQQDLQEDSNDDYTDDSFATIGSPTNTGGKGDVDTRKFPASTSPLKAVVEQEQSLNPTVQDSTATSLEGVRMVRFASKEDVRLFTRSKEEQEFHDAPMPEPEEDAWDSDDLDDENSLSAMAEREAKKQSQEKHDASQEKSVEKDKIGESSKRAKKSEKEGKSKKKKKKKIKKSKSMKKRKKNKGESEEDDLTHEESDNIKRREHNKVQSRSRKNDSDDDDLDPSKPKSMVTSLEGATSISLHGMQKKLSSSQYSDSDSESSTSAENYTERNRGSRRAKGRSVEKKKETSRSMKKTRKMANGDEFENGSDDQGMGYKPSLSYASDEFEDSKSLESDDSDDFHERKLRCHESKKKSRSNASGYISGNMSPTYKSKSRYAQEQNYAGSSSPKHKSKAKKERREDSGKHFMDQSSAGTSSSKSYHEEKQNRDLVSLPNSSVVGGSQGTAGLAQLNAPIGTRPSSSRSSGPRSRPNQPPPKNTFESFDPMASNSSKYINSGLGTWRDALSSR